MRAKAANGEVDPHVLREHEDECIAAVVDMQEAIGLEGVTDGEFRRESFHGDFLDRIDGIEFRLVDPEHRKRSTAPFVAFVTQKIRRPEDGIEVEGFRFLSGLTHRTAKQTIPSPTMVHFRGGREAIDARAYPDLDAFFADLARVYREEIAALGAAGCRYLQIDDTNLAYLCDDAMRARVRARGDDVDRLPDEYAALINESIRSRPRDMSVCVHLCRGNARGQWFAQGGYEAVAETIFNKLDVDGFFLEYDDERSGDFSPLRFVPSDKIIVLGLVTTKRGELEARDVIRRRVEEASRHIDLEQLCLSPQCGFASAAGGNPLSQDEQRAKLELVVELAAEIWG